MNITFSVFVVETGRFTGLRLGGSDIEACRDDIPDGCALIEGEFAPAAWQIVDGAVVPLVLADPPDAATLRRTAIDRRNDMLASCDWVVTRAIETGQPVPSAWQAYRQALRDITAQSGFPTAINWPTPPTE